MKFNILPNHEYADIKNLLLKLNIFWKIEIIAQPYTF